MKRIIFFCWVILSLSIATANARTYKLALGAWAGFSPANVAQVKGFWKELGLDTRTVSKSGPQDIHSLFRSKIVDMMFEKAGTAVDLHMEGLPVVVIMETGWSHGGDKIVAKKFITPELIRGNTVGVYMEKPSVTYFLNRYLSGIGCRLSDIRIAEFEGRSLTNQSVSNNLKIILNYDPEGIRAEKEGDGRVIATTASYEGCMPEGLVVFRDVLAQMPPEDMAKIVKGWIRAVRWIRDPENLGEYRQILNTQTYQAEKPFSEKELKAMLDAVRIHDPETMVNRNQDGGGLAGYLKNLREFLKSNSLLKKDFQVSDVVDSRTVTEALRNP